MTVFSIYLIKIAFILFLMWLLEILKVPMWVEFYFYREALT